MPCLVHLQHLVLLEDSPERGRVEAVVVGHHLNDTGEVGNEVALVAVGEKRGHRCGIKLNVVVVDLDEVGGRVVVYQRNEGVFNSGRDLALRRDSC